jgi:hypothetical protein
MESANSLISVVVPVREARETAPHTLRHLLDRSSLEVIAVVSSADPAAEVLRDLKRSRPELVLIELPGRYSVPQLRARGVAAATGRCVAITEDHCLFPEGWPASLARALERPEIAAAGGGVENGRSRTVRDWAIYFSRYAANMPPLQRGFATILPGNNACYRRELLDELRPIWQEGFWEHEFHRYLLADGWKLWLEADAAVEHHKPYRFGPYCRLRFLHGRCYGGGKRRKEGFAAVALFVLLSPLIPALMALRSARVVLPKRRHRKEYLLSIPLLIILYSAWVAGEMIGYLLGPGESCSQTD